MTETSTGRTVGGVGAKRRNTTWTFPLAYFGVHLAFMPVLVLLLPRRVQLLAEGDALVALSWLLLTGALAASLAHIVAGHWSDRWFARHGNRRGLIAIGFAALTASFVVLGVADSIEQVAAALIAFQLSLNLVFAPLGALLADHVPDASKGRVAGMLHAALPASSGGIALLAWLFPTDNNAAFLVNGGLVAMCIIPLLLLWDFERAPADESVPNGGFARRPQGPHDFVLAWLSRLLVQLGAAFVISFLYLLVDGRIRADPDWVGQGDASGAIALLSLAATSIALIGAIAGGRLSDALSARRAPLSVAAIFVAACLCGLGGGLSWPAFIIVYGGFHLALSAFLAIDAALVAQLVAHSTRRGTLLGIMNLANTFPSVLAPGIALAALGTGVGADQLSIFFLTSAAGIVLAAVMVFRIKAVR